MMLYCDKNIYYGGEGEICTILGHVFDMSFLGIVHVAGSYGRNPEPEITKRYLSRPHYSCIRLINLTMPFQKR